MNEPSEYLLELLHQAEFITEFAAGLLGLVSIAGYLLYFFVVRVIRDRSMKYRFVCRNEINALLTSSLLMAVAVPVFISAAIIKDRDLTNVLAFSMKLIIPLGFGALIITSLHTYFKVYYPSLLEKRLSKIRFKPKKSHINGNSLRLLNEEEEDEYMTKEMIREEEMSLYDYDVWLDETTKIPVIQKYVGNKNALCPNCKFRTLRVVEYEDEGVYTVQKYQCNHCQHKEAKVIDNTDFV